MGSLGVDRWWFLERLVQVLVSIAKVRSVIPSSQPSSLRDLVAYLREFPSTPQVVTAVAYTVGVAAVWGGDGLQTLEDAGVVPALIDVIPPGPFVAGHLPVVDALCYALWSIRENSDTRAGEVDVAVRQPSLVRTLEAAVSAKESQFCPGLVRSSGQTTVTAV